MELFLNVSWAVLAALMIASWLRCGVRDGVHRCVQLLALALLIAILLPVISETDDLQAAHNPADVECCVRRAHEAATPHISNSGAAVPPPVFARLTLETPILFLINVHPAPRVDSPALASIQNRPPPAV